MIYYDGVIVCMLSYPISPMPKSCPPVSVNAQQHGRHRARRRVCSVAIARDSPMSAESEEDGFSQTAEDSPGSQYSFGINAEPLPEDQDGYSMDVPPSPDDLQTDEDMLSADGSTSPQSQYSFSINSMCLPEPQDDRVLPAACIPGVQDEETELLPAAYIPGVQDEETELPPAQVAEECDVSALPVQMEDLMVDFAQPEHGRYFGKVSAILRMDVALPTEAEGVVDNLSAERGKSCSLIIKCH